MNLFPIDPEELFPRRDSKAFPVWSPLNAFGAAGVLLSELHKTGEEVHLTDAQREELDRRLAALSRPDGRLDVRRSQGPLVARGVTRR